MATSKLQVYARRGVLSIFSLSISLSLSLPPYLSLFRSLGCTDTRVVYAVLVCTLVKHEVQTDERILRVATLVRACTRSTRSMLSSARAPGMSKLLVPRCDTCFARNYSRARSTSRTRPRYRPYWNFGLEAFQCFGIAWNFMYRAVIVRGFIRSASHVVPLYLRLERSRALWYAYR